ncbi:MAG: hypothetical protein V1814_02470 [Candidatus Moraniibacteriota bacterium]
MFLKMGENIFSDSKGQINVQEVTGYLDTVFAGLGDVLSALVAHRTKLLTDEEIGRDVKEFDLERSAKAANLTSGAEIQLHELKRIILPFTKY